MSTGYEAEPTDAAALIAHLEEYDDPTELYARASAEQALLEAAARLATGYKARALAKLHRAGMSYAKIAAMPGISETRSGVQKLVEQGRELLYEPAPGEGVIRASGTTSEAHR